MSAYPYGYCFAAAILGFLCWATPLGSAQERQRQQQPYRLESVDLKQRVIWGAQLRQPEGKGLAFGGQDQRADDGRPHTRLWLDGQWKPIHEELRAQNPLQERYARTWRLRTDVKNLCARVRFIYFQGMTARQAAVLVEKDIAPHLSQLSTSIEELERQPSIAVADDYCRGQLEYAKQHLMAAIGMIPQRVTNISPETIRRLHAAQTQLELAAEACDAEPPPRALDCGRGGKQAGTDDSLAERIAYDAKSQVYVLFGGDHLDYLTNDTWIFHSGQRRWMQRRPAGAPAPRANHRLAATGDGSVRLLGGYTYASNTDYVGGQYVDLNDGVWLYDIEGNQWKSVVDTSPVSPDAQRTGDSAANSFSKNSEEAKLVPADTRVYRTGPFHPDYFLQGDPPDAAKFQAWLAELPANEWVVTDPPRRPRLNRDWGTARLDPDRDLLLRWSGGHSAHGGTDVPHFHFATNRWELPIPVEFPLGQLYSNTSYPDGYNFNLRPWMTGHTYQNYAYDPPSKSLVQAGRPRHFYVYDPDVADWVARGEKPEAMQYNSCFYTLTLTATPQGAVCWDRNANVHRYQAKTGQWIKLELTGDKLPGAYVDNSTIAYDSRRDRVLIINTPGYGIPYEGRIWAIDLKTNTVHALSPEGIQHARRFANVDKCCYVASHDLLLLGTYLKDAGQHTPTPAYDCQKNRWLMLDVKYATGERSGRTTRAFPHQRSDALVFDAKRNLIWGTDTMSQVYVLRLK